MKKFSILLTILILTQIGLSQTGYSTYSNDRFGFTISYPDSLKPQGEAQNGDGQIFLDDGVEMRVYGSNMLLHDTLQKEYKAIVKEKGTAITYKVFGKNSFTISGRRSERIFYQKTIKKPDGSFITFLIEYFEWKRSVYDKAITKMVKSFK